MNRRFAFFVLIALLGAAAPAAPIAEGPNLQDALAVEARDSAAACGQAGYGSRPAAGPSALMATTPNPAGPTLVDVFLFVLAINEIDTLSNSFRFEGFGGLIWCDPRHAFDPEEEGTERRMIPNAQAVRYLENVWWPGVFLPTHLGRPEISSERLLLYADGTVMWSGKFNLRLAANYDFTDFPLDTQTLRIPIQGFEDDSNAILLQVAEERVGVDRGFDIPEWTVLAMRTDVGAVSGSRGGDYSEFTLEIDVRRKSGYYVWKIIVPLLMIFTVAWAGFWMRDAQGQRQRMAATGVLSLVAFQFVAAAVVPRVPYLTLLDALMLWSFLVVASSMAGHVWADRRYRKDHQLGTLVDRRLRLVYPLLYVGGLAAITMLRSWLR